MVRYVVGDIFSSSAQTLVNTVNCRGVMGKGLALQFKLRYPEMFQDYARSCRAGKVRIGQPHLYQVDGHLILNFPTKDDWRRPSKLEYIERGLKYFASRYRELGVKSVAFPQLGCQNGGLDWNDVRPLMVRYLDPLDIDIEIYIHRTSAVAMDITEQRIGVLEQINTMVSTAEIRTALNIREYVARAILDHRKACGEFGKLSDLKKVRGIGERTYAKIEAHVRKAETSQREAKSGYPEEAIQERLFV